MTYESKQKVELPCATFSHLLLSLSKIIQNHYTAIYKRLVSITAYLILWNEDKRVFENLIPRVFIWYQEEIKNSFHEFLYFSSNIWLKIPLH